GAASNRDPTARCGVPTSDASDRGDEPPVVLDVRVPALVAGLELGQLVPALGKSHLLGRLRADAVLVPGDVPRDGDDELAAHAGERNDAGSRLAEALCDPTHRAPVVARVEDVGGLDHLQFGPGEAAEDRLSDDGL